MSRVARLVTKYPKIVLFVFVGLVALSGIWGFQVFGSLKGGGYDNPNSDSAEVVELLEKEFDVEANELIVLVDLPVEADAVSPSGPVMFPLVQGLTDEIAAVEGVDAALNYYMLGSPTNLKSQDGHLIFILVNLADDIDQSPVVAEIVDTYSGAYQGAEIHVSGAGAVTKAINEQIESDIIRAEIVAIPIVLILLIFVFGSLVAAGLPILVGGLAIVGSFFIVWGISQLTDVSIFALNLITGLGLGLGIDYSLLVVNRFREERAAGNSVSAAVSKTVASAGKTVFFSGVTVAVVLFSMSFFPQYFLRSFAIAGVAVVTLAVIGATLALPAQLHILGDRINSLRVFRRNLEPNDEGFWKKIARFTMNRPLLILLVSSGFLVSLFSLSSGVVFSQVDDRVLPKNSPAHVASDLLRDRFDGRESSPIEILMKGSDSAIQSFLGNVESQPGVVRVSSPIDSEVGSWKRVTAVADVETRGPDGMDLVVNLRDLDHELDRVLIGGGAAIYTDSQQGIEEQLFLAAGWVVIASFLILFLFTSSVVIPIKAIFLNVLSLGATLGLITWIFQNGELQWLLGEYSVTGTIDTSSVVMIALVAFGLSMDYELFLLSRIKEHHDRGNTTEDSVALGLQRSGRIITAAALILAVTFGAFASSGVSIMKMLGLGIAVAILIDATIVRALLVPSLMKLLGKWNWWAPRWMKLLHGKFGLSH